ncbi:TPA: hypothetical protein ACSCYS_004302 [Aeromonas veronii]
MSFYSRFDSDTIAGLVVMAGVFLVGHLGVDFGDKPLFVYGIVGYLSGALGMSALRRFNQYLSPVRLRPEATRKLSSALQSLDFFHVSHKGAIGVDASRRRIAVLNSVFSPVSVFDFDSVFECALIIRNDTTGLLFDMRNLDAPSVFAPMSEGDAEGWLRILRRMGEGALEAQETPRHYPQ